MSFLPISWCSVDKVFEERELIGMGTELATSNAEAVIGAGTDLVKIALAKPWMLRIEEHPAWDVLSKLRVTLRVGLPLPRFKVRDLLSLQEGQLFESASLSAEDVPLKAGQVQLGWSEFEVLEQRIAVRLTRLQ